MRFTNQRSSLIRISSELPPQPLKRPAVYGIFKWWPENGESWIHPFDVGIVRHLIPSRRVFRREDLCENYLIVSYGAIKFRIRSTLWLEVAHDGLDIGDYVEVKSRMGQTIPFIGQIDDLKWNYRRGHIEYYLRRANSRLARPYRAEELNRVSSIESEQSA